MGNKSSIIKSGERGTKLNEGNIIIYKQCYFDGDHITLSEGEYTNELLDFDNDSISSLILGPNTKVALYEYANFKGYNIVLENNTVDKDYLYKCFKETDNDFAGWTWNNRISSITVNKIRQKELEEGTIKKEFNAKITLGLNELNLTYGAYHHLWLDTNEKPLYIDIFPHESVRVELWTGYHPRQGRKTVVNKARQTILKNIGIIRSIDVQKVRYLNEQQTGSNYEYDNLNEPNNTSSVRQDYKSHFNLRKRKLKVKDKYYDQIEFDGGIVEFFNTSYDSKFVVLWLLILYFIYYTNRWNKINK